MFNEDYDYYSDHQRNMHFEKPMHGPPGPGPRGPPPPHGPPGPLGPGPMRGPPGGPRRRAPEMGPPPPNFHEPVGVFDDFNQRGMPSREMNMRGPPPSGNLPRCPPPGPHFQPPPVGGNEFPPPRQNQPGMPPNKGPFQRPPMMPMPYGMPPGSFPGNNGPGGGGPGGGMGGNHLAAQGNPSNTGSTVPNSSNINLDELWVETKTPDGKSYFYNAKTRETSWKKPENVKVLRQDQIEALAAGLDSGAKHENNKNSLNPVNAPNQFFVPMGAMPGGMAPGMGMMPPPGFGPPPPFAMPPPYVSPPFAMPQFPAMMGVPPINTNATAPTETTKIEVTNESNDSPWVKYTSADGQVYYYNMVTAESTYEKPPGFNDDKNVQPEIEAVVDNEAPVSKTDTAPMEVEELVKNEEINKMEVVCVQENGTDDVKTVEDSSAVEDSSIIKEEVTETKEEQLVSGQEKEVTISSPKPVDKSRPVSCTPIKDSSWCVVFTGDNKIFYFHPRMRLSFWERPDELKNRTDVDKLIECPPSNQKNEPGKESQNDTESLQPESKKIKLENDEDKNNSSEQASNKSNITPGKESAIEAELRAAKERSLVSLDVRVQQFTELLIQKNVSAFSTWERQLHKIVFDPRYLLLTSKERKLVFEKYVKDRVEEERTEKKKKMRERREEFKKLLEQANLTVKSTFSDFAQKYGKDDRFKKIEKMREKEDMFNDYLEDIRRRERDERSSQREKTKKDFLELLKEQKIFDKHIRWNEAKKMLSDDSRYKTVDSSSLREEWFKEFINKMTCDVEDDKSKEREKQERVEASIREREREVQRTLSTHLRERDKERELHKHDEAIQHFRALLSDLVRSPDVSWHEVKKILRKDHRWETVNCLDRDEREKVYEEHVSFLYRKKKEKFRELLDETSDITLSSSWKEVKKLIKSDPRCSKFSSSDRKCEKEFKEYLKDKMVAAKADFRELLKETKIITYKSRKLIEESDHLHDIEKVLQNDKRYLVLQCIEDERQELLMNYIDTLDRKGPPPPPTASEPSRRSTK